MHAIPPEISCPEVPAGQSCSNPGCRMENCREKHECTGKPAGLWKMQGYSPDLTGMMHACSAYRTVKQLGEYQESDDHAIP